MALDSEAVLLNACLDTNKGRSPISTCFAYPKLVQWRSSCNEERLGLFFFWLINISKKIVA